MSPEAIIGWDVGGAHLKAARLGASGRIEAVIQRPCPLWQGMDRLHSAVSEVLSHVGSAPRHAVTMTGEMVDLFPSRPEGIAALVAAMQGRLAGSDVRYYAGPDGFVDADQARSRADRVASANWMASAALAAARVGTAILLDIGTTTTDIIPVADGEVRAAGYDDMTRLVTGELVYTGVVRTPVMAMAPSVPFAGHSVPLIAEYFATAADVHRLMGTLPEHADQHPAADGGEKTVAGSARRLARMIGKDSASATLDDWKALANRLAQAQLAQIAGALEQVAARALIPRDAPLVAAGAGRFLAPALAAQVGRTVTDFGELVPADAAIKGVASDCAPAVAVACLLSGSG